MTRRLTGRKNGRRRATAGRLLLVAAVSLNLCGVLPGLTDASPAQEKNPAGRQREGGHARERVNQEEAARKLLQAKLIDVLRQTAQESKQWEKKEVAAGVQVIAADLIWEVDAEIARDLLVLAWETLGRIEYPKQSRSGYRNYSKRASDRREVLYVAKRRDPELARKWLEDRSPLDAGQTDLAPAVRRFTGIIPAESAVAASGFSFNSALAGFRAQDFDAVYSALKKVEAPEARGVAIVNACRHFFKVSGKKSKADLKSRLNSRGSEQCPNTASREAEVSLPPNICNARSMRRMSGLF